MKKLILSICIFLSVIFVHGQTTPVQKDTVPVKLDTVYLMSGKVVTGVVKDSVDQELRILVPKKGSFKADFIDLDLVYSVKYAATGKEAIFYKQDTLFGNYYTPQEVKYFIEGETDARRAYHCPLWNAGAFAAGFAGGYTRGYVITFIVPFAYSLSTTFFRVKIKPGTVSKPDDLKYDTYLLGYEKEARKRRVFHALIWSGIGTVVGYATSVIVSSLSK